MSHLDLFEHYNGDWYSRSSLPEGCRRIGTFDEAASAIERDMLKQLQASAEGDVLGRCLRAIVTFLVNSTCDGVPTGRTRALSSRELPALESPSALLELGVCPLLDLRIVAGQESGPGIAVDVSTVDPGEVDAVVSMMSELATSPSGAADAIHKFYQKLQAGLSETQKSDDRAKSVGLASIREWFPNLGLDSMLRKVTPAGIALEVTLEAPTQMAVLESCLNDLPDETRTALDAAHLRRALIPLSEARDEAATLSALSEVAPFLVGEWYRRARAPFAGVDQLRVIFEDLKSEFLSLLPALDPSTWATERMSSIGLQVGGADHDDLSVNDLEVNIAFQGSALDAVLAAMRASTHLYFRGLRTTTPWDMPSHVFNAYYSVEANSVYVTGALLEGIAPWGEESELRGSIGALLVHEMSHALDGDSHRLASRPGRSDVTASLVAGLRRYLDVARTRYPGRVNVDLVLDEAFADLLGLRVALNALPTRETAEIEGFSKGWGMLLRGKCSEEEAKRRLAVDPHPPLDVRCNLLTLFPEVSRCFEEQGHGAPPKDHGLSNLLANLGSADPTC